MLANSNKFFDATKSLQNFNQTFKDSGFYYQGVQLEPVNENPEHSPTRVHFTENSSSLNPTESLTRVLERITKDKQTVRQQ